MTRGNASIPQGKYRDEQRRRPVDVEKPFTSVSSLLTKDLMVGPCRFRRARGHFVQIFSSDNLSLKQAKFPLQTGVPVASLENHDDETDE